MEESDKKKNLIPIRLNDEHYAMAQRLAKDDSRSLNNWIYILVTSYLETYKK